MSQLLRYEPTTRGGGRKFPFRKTGFACLIPGFGGREAVSASSSREALRITMGKQKRTGPEQPDRCVWESLFGFFSGCRSFQDAGLAEKISEPIQDLVGPEPLEAVQGLGSGREL